MLLEAKIVHIPARREIDADLNEFGTLATNTRAAFGRAGIEAAGGDDPNDIITSAGDAIANILHAVAYETGNSMDSALRALQAGELHFTAELTGQEP